MQTPNSSLIILDSVDSTNNYAMALIHSGMAIDRTGVFTWHQTNGKGRRAKSWKTEPGENITASFIYNAGIAIYQQFYLHLASSLACADLLKKLQIEDVKIKWPNDIYHNDKKAGGILIENVISGSELNWSVIGIGLNINQKTFDQLSNATSIGNITGKKFDILELTNQLQSFLNRRIDEIRDGRAKDMLTEYNSLLYSLNCTRKFKKGNQIFESNVKGVDINGNLILNNGIENEFQFNEIEWII